MGLDGVWRDRLRREFGVEAPPGGTVEELRELYRAIQARPARERGQRLLEGVGLAVDPAARGVEVVAAVARGDTGARWAAPIPASPSARPERSGSPAATGGRHDWVGGHAERLMESRARAKLPRVGPVGRRAVPGDALELVRVQRGALDRAEVTLHEAIRAAVAGGATLRQLEEPAGLKKSRLAEIVGRR